MAIGAVDRDLVSLVLGGGLKMAAYGFTLGVFGVAGAVWALVRYLDVNEIGVLPFSLSAVTIAILATVASVFPAWRAVRLSPLAAMRDEPGSIWRSASLEPTTEEEGEPRLIDFSHASRKSDSFAQAIENAIETLRNQIRASRAVLARDVADYPFLMNRLEAFPHPLPVTDGDLDAWLRWAREQKPQRVKEL
jgi:hypothetical protein